MNYRDKAPEFFKDLNSAGIMSFFEDERASVEEKNWLKGILTSPEYQMKDNPISKYNWGKIKTAFAREFFPDIAPAEVKAKTMTMSERIEAFLNS
jgi:hypothetical protein